MQISYRQVGKRIKNTPIIVSVLLNLVAVTIVFLLFEPTMKSDDYDMCNLLYGGVNGQYQSQLLYCSIVWGKILVGLLKIFPSVAWYTVLQYFLIISAFISVDMIFFEKNEKFSGPLFILSIFLSYEFLIRFTFSKTSGILMVVGYMILLDVLEQRRQWGRLVLGCSFLFFGMIIRLSLNYFLMISLIFGGALVISCMKLKSGKTIVKQVVLFASVALVLAGTCWGITRYSIGVFQKDEDWKDYLVLNSARASVVDYEIPDYNLYEEDYQKLGVSYNDYAMWFVNANRGDSERLTEKLYKKIASLLQKDKSETRVELVEITRNLLNYMANNTVSYVFLIVALLMLITISKWNILVLGVMSVDFIFCYGYMYIAGRVQHHIDAVLMLGIVFIVLYYAQIDINSKKQKVTICMAALVVTMTFLSKFSEELSSNSYYGTSFLSLSQEQKEYYEKNHEDYSLMSEDKAHLYVTESMDTNNTYPCFLPLEVFEKNFYSNIYRPNMNHIRIYEDEVRKYGVDNIYKDITDSDVIYYATSDYTDNNKQVMLQYIRENYNANAMIHLAKKLDHSNIYQFYDDTYAFPQEEAQHIDSTFDEKVNITLENGSLIVSGYAFQKNTDAYDQKIYVKLTNVYDGSDQWFMTTQCENMNERESKEYRYSGFESIICLEENKIDLYDVSVYLENQNGLFILE